MKNRERTVKGCDFPSMQNSQWNACSWPVGAWGVAFPYTAGGDRVIWKWVKKIDVWLCCTCFYCLYCGSILPLIFGLTNALLHKCFWFQWEFEGNNMVLALRAVESCYLSLLSALLCKWVFESGSVRNKFGCFVFIKCVAVRSAEECMLGAARRGSSHNSHSKTLLQIVKHNFMIALLNFIGGSASKLDLAVGHSEWHLARKIDGHCCNLGLVVEGKEIVFHCCTVFIMDTRYFIVMKPLWSIFML